MNNDRQDSFLEWFFIIYFVFFGIFAIYAIMSVR